MTSRVRCRHDESTITKEGPQKIKCMSSEGPLVWAHTKAWHEGPLEVIHTPNRWRQERHCSSAKDVEQFRKQYGVVSDDRALLMTIWRCQWRHGGVEQQTASFKSVLSRPWCRLKNSTAIYVCSLCMQFRRMNDCCWQKANRTCLSSVLVSILNDKHSR